MTRVFLILLMSCLASSIRIQRNITLNIPSASVPVKSAASTLTPYQIDHAKQPDRVNGDKEEIGKHIQTYGNTPLKDNTDNVHLKDNRGASTTHKYVFNEFPTAEEMGRLNFIRESMKAVLGTSKLCDKRQAHWVPESPCFQGCSCDVTCHVTGDCCPDVQHIRVTVTGHDSTWQPHTPQPKCTRIPAILNEPPTTRPPSYNVKTAHESIAPSKNTTILHSTTANKDDRMQKGTRQGSVMQWDKIAMENGVQSNPDPQYLVITSCPRTFTDKSTIQKCLQGTGTRLQDIAPVYDRLSHKIYKNEHCALCNGAQQTSYWTIESDCIQLYANNCLTNKLSHLVQMTKQEQCKIVFAPPMYTDLSTLQCRSEVSRKSVNVSNENALETASPGLIASGVIASCNVTGLWTQQEKITADLCSKPNTINHFYQYVEGQALVYRNMFCYLCNQPIKDTALQKPSCQRDTLSKNNKSGSLFPNTRVILDLDEFEMDEDSECNNSNLPTIKLSHSDEKTCNIDTFWDVYMKKCRQLFCPIHQIPLRKMCLEKKRMVEGLIFSAQLMITMGKDDFISTNVSFTDSLTPLFESVYRTIDTYLGLSVSNCITKHAEVLAKTENKKINFFFMKVKIANTFECSVHTLTDIFDRIATKKVLHDTDLLETYNISMLQVGLEFRPVSLKDIGFHHVVVNVPYDTRNEIKLKPLYNCPTIKLSMKEYEQSVKENFIEKLDQKDFNLQFSTKTNTVEICLMPYLQTWILSKYWSLRPRAPDTDNTLDTTLSMIATLTSMISTIITLITYGLFSELRFVPGKLFMILCLNLLLAQLFFAFGKNSGYPPAWCKFLGIGIHFFWLATIFSMNSCMILMVRSVKAPLEHQNRLIMQSRSISKASKYILFSYIGPLLIVASTLLVAWIKKEPYGGYGGEFCYISTIFLRIYTFAVPVGIVIAINFTIFTLIFTTMMCKMKNTMMLKGNYRHILIFLKLCTMTGIFWTFGFIYEATRIEYFMYLFTVLNGGQGFFLMWSFIFNKKVLHLYIHRSKQYIHKLHDWTISTTTV